MSAYKTDIPIKEIKVAVAEHKLRMSLRFIIFASFLIFVIASTLFTASLCKGAYSVGFNAASDEKVRPNNVYVVAAAAAAREKTSRSRKMVVDRPPTLNKNVKIDALANEKQTNFRRTTLSGNKNAKLVAFTEDYHKPRHHPPKNN